MKPDFCLQGKIALITGGSRGIGRATALAFAEAGADVAIASRTLADLEKVAEEIRGLGRQSLAVEAHVGRMKDINNLVNKVTERFGRIDILVNNAGTNPSGLKTLIDIDEGVWDAAINLNLKGLFFLSQAVARGMKEHGGGRIINVSSVSAIKPGRVSLYTISKAAVITATRVMAKEWGKYGINVNAVAPGVVKTDFSAVLWNDPEIAKTYLRNIPLGRFGEAEEVVGAMLYLASGAAQFVTGAVLSVDGGEAI